MYKSGPQDDPFNYREISLINVMYKIFSNIIHDRLYTWAEKFDKIDESQAEFRAGNSTIYNIFILQSMVVNRADDLMFFMLIFKRHLMDLNILIYSILLTDVALGGIYFVFFTQNCADVYK
jgi:hypothetical protein